MYAVEVMRLVAPQQKNPTFDTLERKNPWDKNHVVLHYKIW